MQPAELFNELISQTYEEESLPRIISGAYDYSNVLDKDGQNEYINLLSNIWDHLLRGVVWNV